MQDVIIATVRAIYRDTGLPAKSTAVAARCYVSRSTAWRWLKTAEQEQIVKFSGYGRGWLPANMN